MRRRLVPGFLALLGFLAPATAAPAQAVAPGGDGGAGWRPLHGLDLPASFQGTLPCADCPGIVTRIDLWPDQSFHATGTYVDRGLTVQDLGRWVPDPETGALILRGQDGAERRFAPQPPDGLRMLDAGGQPIASDLPYTLTATGFDAVPVTLTLQGEVTYLADAARFDECVSGRSYPVAFEDAWIDAERLYLERRTAPGAPLLMTLTVEIAPRPPMEGAGTPMTVIPRAVIGAFPGETCAREGAAAALTGTWWRIDSLDGVPLDPEQGTRAPHLVLSARTGRYRATAGCNQMLGGFVAADKGNGLRLAPGATTLMACPPPLDGWERALTAALAATDRHEILGDTLILRDADDAERAVLRAVYLF
jgi:copper homeostasis protein (lipoprotein)